MKKIAIIDFGGQYTHLIARRIRYLGIFSEIFHPEKFIMESEIVGIIFSGGPQSVNSDDAFKIKIDIEKITIPILGICYGHQILASLLGGEIESGKNQEYGKTEIVCEPDSVLFQNLNREQTVWMSHGDHVQKLPASCRITSFSQTLKITSFESLDKKFFGVQFHPEVSHTENGIAMLDNFLSLCSKKRIWKPENFKNDLIQQIRNKAIGKKLALLLSGGVDSLVTLQLCIAAVGNENIFSIHIDTGFMRQNESQEILEHFREFGFQNIKIIEAENEYLQKLENITDPEQKRMIIGKLFVEIADREIRRLEKKHDVLLVQGTIYPDTIESGSTEKSAMIKTHHNRVDEIQKLIAENRVIEPIKNLYKDEVRQLGEELQLPKKLLYRHPFPGPGLAIRMICSHKAEPTAKYQKENNELNLFLKTFEMQGNILPIRSVGVQGDYRTYHHPAVIWFKDNRKFNWENVIVITSRIINKLETVNRILFSANKADFHLKKMFLKKSDIDKLRKVDAILRHETEQIQEIWQMPIVSLPLFNELGQAFVMRPICSLDAMTASVYQMDIKEMIRLEKLVRKIPNVGNLLYDVTSKPPATIEWE